jgi:hypothetical protein
MKKVQKFQPGICLWLSERFTSSSLCATAESKEDNKPSLSLLRNSAHDVGLLYPAVHANCTHLLK